ncbi:RNA polymerase sigma factor for flagellar operon FliA [Altererythrobacter atlanticus]|uniref:RNA polymerase sigma factor FliA n=1 Tax=Croceibacterium atlanticum TaxID=1267766 RepID=A0A0F7KY96_9SPHN|nr:sigma-70 family RNA polymerase sigma factor [Croceibacterium atlanticum]AKH44192.1 RNA polymerase sigma factor FliA [Croceibacterium atlanticum]MBB5732503.1 RNA polymerase sigma factor for flagellar operon FliA [Croceibacterium atlanticum]
MIHNHAGLQAERVYRDPIGERVARFLPMVRKYAWHLAGSAGPELDAEDLMQAGLIALTECAQRHEGPGEDGFAAYAKLRVRGAMVDLLRSSSTEARGTRERRLRLEKAEQALRAQLGREPHMAELAQALGLSVEETSRLRAGSAQVSLTSIDDCYSDSDGSFASDMPDAEEILLQQEDRSQLIEAISALPERLQMVIQLYFVEELNLSEIASILDVSVPRVHQLKASALKQIRSQMDGM